MIICLPLGAGAAGVGVGGFGFGVDPGGVLLFSSCGRSIGSVTFVGRIVSLIRDVENGSADASRFARAASEKFCCCR